MFRASHRERSRRICTIVMARHTLFKVVTLSSRIVIFRGSFIARSLMWPVSIASLLKSTALINRLSGPSSKVSP